MTGLLCYLDVTIQMEDLTDLYMLPLLEAMRVTEKDRKPLFRYTADLGEYSKKETYFSISNPYSLGHYIP